MGKISKINSQDILKVGNTSLTFQNAFQHVLENFIQTPTRAFGLLETVVLSCVLVEAVVKNQLKKINPALVLDKIDAESIALVSKKHKKLLKKPTMNMSDIKTVAVTVLIERYAQFQDISKYRNGLDAFFKLRNQILHSAEDVNLDESRIAILLTKYMFPFIKKYVDVDDQVWKNIKKIETVAHYDFGRDLVRKILEYREYGKKLSADKEILEHILQYRSVVGKDKFLQEKDLVCPACHNDSINLIIGVDFDTSDGETVTHGYQFAECRVCDIHLNEIELSEIIGTPTNYFSPSEGKLTAWERAISNPNYSEYI